MVGTDYFVKNGKGEFRILLPENPPKAILTAAEELCTLTAESSGAILEIDSVEVEGIRYLSIGRTKLLEKAKLGTNYETLNGDGFAIKEKDGNIIFDAKTDRGFLYATYEFLERVVGVRFFSVEETFIPKQMNIPLPKLDILSVPAFQLRTFLNYTSYPDGKDERFSARLRTLHNFFDFSEEFGGKPPLYSRRYRTHNARFFVPAEKYGTRESTGYKGEFSFDHDPHPEFYHMTQGHEPNWDSGAFGPTFDWANGITEDGKLDESLSISVAKIVIEEMKKDVLANPDAEFFQLDQEDCVDLVTNRELFEKYTPAGVLIRFCNVIATELQKWANEELNGRKINIVTFAYQQTMHAPVVKNENGEYVPVDPTVVPVENLYIRLAYMSFHYYPYADWRQPQEVLEMISSWSAICKHFWFWGYDAMFNDYNVYNPSFGQAKGTVCQMRDVGVEYFIMLSSYNQKYNWQADMKQYVWMKLLWNPEADDKALKEEYIDGYYRSVGNYVREMMKLLDDKAAEIVGALEPGHDEYNIYHEMFIPKNIDGQILKDAAAIIEKGERALQADNTLSIEEKEILSVRLARVKFTPLWMLLKYYREFYPNASEETEMELLKEILAMLKIIGVDRYSEAIAMEEYLNEKYGKGKTILDRGLWV